MAHVSIPSFDLYHTTATYKISHHFPPSLAWQTIPLCVLTVLLAVLEIYKRISPNLRNGTLISLYNHIPFIFECFHDQQDSSRREKPSRKYCTRYSQNRQIIVFLSSFFLSSFRRASSTSPQSLMMVFARNSSILHRAVHQPIAFWQPPSLHQAATAAHSITMASFVTPFSCLYACALKRSLSNDT